MTHPRSILVQRRAQHHRQPYSASRETRPYFSIALESLAPKELGQNPLEKRLRPRWWQQRPRRRGLPCRISFYLDFPNRLDWQRWFIYRGDEETTWIAEGADDVLGFLTYLRSHRRWAVCSQILARHRNAREKYLTRGEDPSGGGMDRQMNTSLIIEDYV